MTESLFQETELWIRNPSTLLASSKYNYLETITYHLFKELPKRQTP